MDNSELQNDPLDSAFDPLGLPPDVEALRTKLLSQTLGVMRRRRLAKRCCLAAGLFGCYLAGIFTMGLWSNANASSPSQAIPPTMAQPSTEKTIPTSQAIGNSTKRQVAVKLSGFEAWRRFGDNSLRETGDISLAVAGYSNAIHHATNEELAVSSQQDNWILKALKYEQLKERNHARTERN
jgi:hypothetical protein